MIVVWLNKRKVTPLITCDLQRIGNSPLCRIHNIHAFKYPRLAFMLEVMTMICYWNYFSYLVFGALWLPVRLLLPKSAIGFSFSFRELLVSMKYLTFIREKRKLDRTYLRLVQMQKLSRFK